MSLRSGVRDRDRDRDRDRVGTETGTGLGLGTGSKTLSIGNKISLWANDCQRQGSQRAREIWF